MLNSGADAPSELTQREAGSLFKRLAMGGLPSLLATATLVLLPILGRLYLNDGEYTGWALLATLGTASLIVDFGGAPYVTRLAGAGVLTRRGMVRGAIMSVAGSVLLTVIVLAIWPYYSANAHVEMGTQSGLVAILLIGAGTALRSCVVTIAYVALGLKQYRLRGGLLLSQAVLQVLATTIVLHQNGGVWALPIGFILSAVMVLPFAAKWSFDVLPNGPGVTTDPKYDARTKQFATSRGLITLLGLTLTQLDRWALALVAPASYLADYDTAARFATLPKTLVISVSVGLVAEAAEDRLSNPELLRLVNRSLKLMMTLILLATVGCLTGVYIIGQLKAFATGQRFFVLLALMFLWQGINALTAPVSLVLSGRGHPERELWYLVPAFMLTTLGWILAVVMGLPNLAVAAVGVPLGVASLAFIVARARLMEGV